MKIPVKYYLLIIILAFSGCEKWMELEPQDELVQDKYWQTKEDVQAVLMSAYQQFAQMDESLFIFGELRADMLVPISASPDQQLLMQGNLEPDNSLCRWSNFYKVINYCNYVLEFAPIAYERDETFTEYQLNGFESEALFLRGLAYFYLVRIFQNVPLVLNSSKTDGQDFFKSKTSEEDILSKVKEDLKVARLISTGDFGSLEQNKGRARKDAINALLADISLWQFDYQECINYCNTISEEEYVLLPGSEWFTLYYPGNSLESIFEFQYDDALSQPNNIYDLTYNVRRFDVSDYTQEILDPEKAKENYRSYSYTNTILSYKKIWKYAGNEADRNFSSVRPGSELRSSNWIIYRFADVLLMKAEALNQLERYEDAIIIINRIRRRANVELINPSYNKKIIEDIILTERAKELAFEGKRWFDLLRMGRRNNFERKEDLIERMIQNVPATQKLVLSSKLNDPNGWYFPVHIDELEANKNLEQNSYYSSFIIEK